MNILIIEDEADLAAAIGDYLTLQGATCDFAYQGESGVVLAQAQRFDVIILDLVLPKKGGFEVCEQLRSEGNNTPVLMLTACDTNTEQLKGFQAGIDDYVIKPCPMPLLWARLQALYRRDHPPAAQLSIDTLTLYFKELRVAREGYEIKLTPTGWKMLELLALRSPEVVSRAELEDYAWPDHGPDHEVDAGNFNVQLHQLRKAVDKSFAYPLVRTLVGVGLCLRKKTAFNA
ncbi:MAG: response regulator transcription factor [Gammaproteobacteria bacterium]|nr:response regulator transcription factor [Gammaproteobacteria bacterium]